MSRTVAALPAGSRITDSRVPTLNSGEMSRLITTAVRKTRASAGSVLRAVQMQ